MNLEEKIKVLKGLMAGIRATGLAEVTQVGTEGFWQITVLESPVSEKLTVPGSQVLPLGSPQGSPSYSPSVPPPTPTPTLLGTTGRATPVREEAGQHQNGLVNQKSLNHHLDCKKHAKKRGAQNLDLFKGENQSMSSNQAQDFMGVWNGALVLPKIVSMRGRENLIRIAMQDEFFRGNYREGIKRVAASKFCRGANKLRWRATVDWFMQSHILPRILEGAYDDNSHPQLTPEDQKYTTETI